MQTFLPYANFQQSAACLDNKRLGKQRVEAYQILDVLCGLTRGWRNHPAVRMWRGYDDALTLYLNTCIIEWEHRGFKNSIEMLEPFDIVMPPWLGNEAIHASHRSNLLRKDFEYYSKFNWVESPTLEYVWPV